jgi:hypothetical protein
VLAIVLNPSGRYPDSAMSVVIGEPLACTAVAVNLQQLRAARFDGGKLLGEVDPAAMARVDHGCAPSSICSPLADGGPPAGPGGLDAEGGD